VGGELEVAVTAGQAKVIRVEPLDFRKLVGRAREANLLDIEINKSAGC
jgi:hypothetical protein